MLTHHNFEECRDGALLSNDPGKVDSNFFCYAATGNVLIFTQSINLHEGRLHNKMHLRSTLKDCFFCVKRF